MWIRNSVHCEAVLVHGNQPMEWLPIAGCQLPVTRCHISTGVYQNSSMHKLILTFVPKIVVIARTVHLGNISSYHFGVAMPNDAGRPLFVCMHAYVCVPIDWNNITNHRYQQQAGTRQTIDVPRFTTIEMFLCIFDYMLIEQLRGHKLHNAHAYTPFVCVTMCRLF